MVIDKDKQYRTTDGCDARIYATDGSLPKPIHGAVYRAGDWVSVNWFGNGREFVEDVSPNDLVEIKPRIKRTYWINLYSDDVRSVTHDSKEDADRFVYRVADRIACVKIVIDCEEGEGL